ncbi:MAG: hypothetical protein ACYCXY_09780 [Acidimicrobiales bacterium]
MPVALKEPKGVAFGECAKPPDVIDALLKVGFGDLRLEFVVDTVWTLTPDPKPVRR